MGKIKSVLFVCTGNSCRSVMAEGLLKRELARLGKAGIEVRSAGVRALGGFAPTAETIEAMSEKGVDVSGYKSKALTDELIRSADLILVMEGAHKSEVARRAPEAASRIFLLKEFGLKTKASGGENAIEDPIGMPIDFYEKCINDIEKETERISRLL